MSAQISQYVLKVTSRCDLACDHCYVYEHADQSWRAKPKIIAEAAARQVARRIREHAQAHQLDLVHVVLHGGEPLLLGHDRLREVVSVLRCLIDPVTELDLRIHTNGVLLDEKLCSLFADYAVKVGVSLDGDRTANDRHRRFADSRSSYAQVRRALALLRRPEYRHLYAGILCTVDVENDPIAVYEALLAEAPPRLDLLLPHGTWDQPPPGPPGTQTPYASWLSRIHSRWVADGCLVPIRFFDSLLAAWEGRPSGSEAAGLDPVDLLVIETDGTWEQVDSLKVAYENAPATGFDVFSHSVDEVAAHPGVAGRQAGLAALCSTCRECPLVRACGGGLYTHRYRSANGFDNPSVYCDDFKVLLPRVIANPRGAVSATSAHGGGSPLADQVPPESDQIPPEGALERLSAGPGDATAMTWLADSYWSVIRALVATVASGLDFKGGNLRRAAAEGWRLLAELDAEQPEVVREVLSYPYVQVWAMRCLRSARSASLDLDLAHLAGMAAAAALRAGLDVELVLPVRNGAICLPTVGALAVAPGVGRFSVAHISPSGISTRNGSYGWQAVRRVIAGEFSITVEDTDPFRDCQAWAASGRLTDDMWRSWRQALVDAAGQLTAEVPAYANVIATGLRSVVPMRPGAAGSRRSGTARDAFGALALGLPDSVDSLGELLVHEMQHVKLTALCDLFDLFDREDQALFPVPWRADPRPVEGLLHGTYAHLAVADLWRSRSRQTPGGQARQLFVMYRSWVEAGLEALLNQAALTPGGRRFADGMRATVEAWADDR
jgi:uncharacterized protein